MNLLKKAIFLETYSETVNRDAIFVSLDPTVSYRLQTQGLSYRILEDYCEGREILSPAAGYFDEQLVWFRMFDDFIRHHISYCGEHMLPLASANYLRIKYFIDTVIFHAITLRRFFTQNGDIDEVEFIRRPFPTPVADSVFELYCAKEKILRDLTHAFCEKYGIRWVERETGRVVHTAESRGGAASQHGHFAKEQLKKITSCLHYRKFMKTRSPEKPFERLTVFFMHAGSPIADIILTELIRQGVRVFFREGSAVVREDVFERAKVTMPEDDQEQIGTLRRESTMCGESLSGAHDLIRWISDRCGFDVSVVVLPFFRKFLTDDAFHILRDSERMYRFYRAHGITTVMALHNVDKNTVGALIAAKYRKAADSICIQHAAFATDREVFSVLDTEIYDYVLTSHAISQRYLEQSLQERYPAACRPIESPHYIAALAERRYAQGKRDRVIFIEKKLLGIIKCFNNLPYGYTWYFEYLKRVMDYFSTEMGFEFIYKRAPRHQWTEDSIIPYIKERGYSNIKICGGQLLSYLPHAQRVIVDFPSGALFEVAAARKAVLALFPVYMNSIGYAQEVFGKSLRQFSSLDEAIAVMREFIHGDPHDYRVDLKPYKPDMTEIFRRISEKNGAALSRRGSPIPSGVGI